MDERRLREALATASVPDAADARLRARAVVLRAHAARPAGRRRRRRAIVPGVGIAVAAALALGTPAAVSGPATVARWMGTTLSLGHTTPPPASLSDLPGGGRLLATGGGRAWITGDGATQRLSAVTGQAAWSAFGHFLAQARGATLQATDLAGRVAWRQRYGAAVHDPRWSPDGNRVAFRVGAILHVTAGDGTGAHPVRATGAARALAVAPVATAWQPGPTHTVAVVLAARRIALVDVDTGAVALTLPAPAATRSLAWSADGRRLLAVGAHEARLVAPDGRVLWRRRTAGPARLVAGRLSPDGRRVALVRQGRRGVQAVLLLGGDGPGRTLVTGRRLPAPLFAPDGRWLLVDWPERDSWLFFATADGDRRVRQVTGVRARVGGAAATVQGWCCAPRP